jgi:nitroreductase
MDAIEAIHGRRSIREYTDESVSEEDVEVLLRAAMAAPSAGNQQPWHFVVIDDREVLDAIPEYHPYSSMLRHAPLAITVCGDLDEEKHEGFWVQDCSAAVENLLIAAHARGLGAVWLGVHPDPERVQGTQGLLGLPDQVVPLAIIAVGHPAEDKSPATYYELNRVHRNRW